MFGICLRKLLWLLPFCISGILGKHLYSTAFSTKGMYVLNPYRPFPKSPKS